MKNIGLHYKNFQARTYVSAQMWVTIFSLFAILSCSSDADRTRASGLVRAHRQEVQEDKIHAASLQIREYIMLRKETNSVSFQQIEQLVDAIIAYNPCTSDDRIPVYYIISELIVGGKRAYLTDDDIDQWFKDHPAWTTSPQATFLLSVFEHTHTAVSFNLPPAQVFEELKNTYISKK